MKINRIALELGAAVMALMIVILVFSGFAVDRLFMNFYDTQMKEDTQQIAAHFTTMAESGEATTQSMIRTFAEFSDVEVLWVNDRGKIVTFPGEEENLSLIKAQDTRRLLEGHAESFLRSDARGKFYIVGRPVQKGGATHSAIYVMASTKNMEASLQQLRNLLLLSGLGAFLLALGLIVIMSKLFSRPLLKMQQMTDKMAKGNWDTRLQVKGRDEIGKLGRSINDLAASLQRYRDSRRAFFSNISHELRTPVTYLQGYAKVLNDGLVDSEREKKQYLSIIYQESVRLEHLIHDLFDLAKMEEGRITLSLEPLDLKEMAKTAMQKVRLKAEKKQLSLQLELQDHVPPVYGDRQRMEQVLLNLLENAIRYTERGHVSVQLTDEKEATVLSVSDTGIGIPEHELPYLFDRFYRVEKSRARKYGGTGLGLSIVKKYVEMQGGTVDVKSQKGTGTTFILRFPHKK
ncbi:HAMP domain-containing sensor histidine kinase [Sporolactobacillus sp. Y61]|jgi:signal transduction histidine kinase|uniref:histidine kinase n=1 Tax=Sporolactobacillus sp. Y61 TaxID=3160863 RepID=A0AAU8IGD2_9BACL|nr:HAMP domain-containing sensor histidine kinase [Sporolactobacillus sp. THM19-2]RYL87519.1 HAMP domain-containing histidine kinase [Sporolactobacillus sp. THM19-2]